METDDRDLFFKDLCSSTLKVENLVRMAKNIVVISNKLEKILPPGFFDVMEHLPIHLVHEHKALLGGPVQYRWMHLFEWSIGKSKRGIKNKHGVECCMVQVYLAKERSHFCSYYFDDYVSCLRNRPNRHDDTGNDPAVQSLSIFNQSAVHPVFHISMLKKCMRDPSLIIPTGIKDNLSYEEVSVQILDLQVRKLRTKEVASTKVLWRNQFVEEATWEAEEEISTSL
ncbi:hypothetical protein MTR67_033827 [Solanum verrucosum]|uniref:DUF4218 domain-containing protein n=1 Tax=Solanum verrucosum TaxID=315347 RepID=A0AAF0ZIN0_SOLVR|nr:hypothetical protein MTR67_033827 [Solanum verrucosum]